ncbi:MAG: hypothetical protein IKV90_10255 [Clostridia bacterium]|nr:hypothetical protein [Clostridia bacterium]
MEMASGCPRQPALRQDTTQETPPKPVRGPHGGWQRREIDALRTRIAQAESCGESLRSVFDDMSRELGRKPNSIRNFYYAQLREAQEGESARPLPFETFTKQEIEQLIRSVLTARAQGMSVRACVRSLAGGDKSLMLRYQNKYRSVVRTRPELVKAIMEELNREGAAYVSPYPSDDAKAAGAKVAQLKTRAQETGDAQIMQLLSSLDHLLSLACQRRQEAEPAPEAAFPADSAAVRRADRLRAQLDVTRIALDEERTHKDKLRQETEGMVTVIKEFIALPERERPGRIDAFCRLAAARLSAVECALMETF